MHNLSIQDYDNYYAVDLRPGMVVADGTIEGVERSGLLATDPPNHVFLTFVGGGSRWARIGEVVAVYARFTDWPGE